MAKLTGQILYIYPTQQLTSKSGNAFQKRDFVVAVQTFDRDTGEPTIDPENTPQLSLTGERCSQLDDVFVGQIVTVDFYLRGRRFRGDDNKEKIITDINVTNVRPIGSAIQTPPSQPAPSAGSKESPEATNNNQANSSTKTDDDDLPF